MRHSSTHKVTSNALEPIGEAARFDAANNHESAQEFRE
jgi:hypothetical protein